MALKSYRIMFKKGKKKKKRGLSDTGRIISQGTTAIIGVGLLGATISAVNRI